MSHKRNNPVLETLSPADRARFLNMVKKGISRRDFMHYMMAAGATAAASGTLFTGMSDGWANTPKTSMARTTRSIRLCLHLPSTTSAGGCITAR